MPIPTYLKLHLHVLTDLGKKVKYFEKHARFDLEIISENEFEFKEPVGGPLWNIFESINKFW